MLEILYEDDICVAVLKPAGLATQAPPGIDSLELRARTLLEQRIAAAGLPAQASREIYLGLPHRLDRCASGVLLLAKTRRAARTLSRQFERRQVRKIYWACVEGTIQPPGLSGATAPEPAALAIDTWTDYLRKIPDEPRAEIVSSDHPEAKQAVLHYRVVGATAIGSWLEIELKTGRTHQIRVQAAARAHPVIGDSLYGSRISFGPQSADERDREIALHARQISFTQPDTKASVTVVAPLPPSWNEFVLPSGAD